MSSAFRPTRCRCARISDVSVPVFSAACSVRTVGFGAALYAGKSLSDNSLRFRLFAPHPPEDEWRSDVESGGNLTF